jgi:hypothetical protein
MQLHPTESERDRQLHAILFTLVTLGHIDGTFDPRERSFIEERIQEMVDDWVSGSPFYADMDPGFLDAVKRYERRYLLEVLDTIEASVSKLLTVEVGVDDQRDAFIQSRLTLRCFEVLSEFSVAERQTIVGLVDRLIQADGVVHPAELRFRDALVTELGRSPVARSPRPERPFDLVLHPVDRPAAVEADAAFFASIEMPFSGDPAIRAAQAESDVALLRQGIRTLATVRRPGWGQLGAARTVDDLQSSPPFMDGLVAWSPPTAGRPTEYIVVGDLHGCYACLKAVLLQSDFFGRVARHRDAPDQEPDVRLIFLGDFLDRGQFGLEGVVRTLVRLFVDFPEHVIPLVGNHEWLLERGGRFVSAVAPADSVDTWAPLLPHEYFSTAKTFFDQLPSVVLADRTVFLHGGLPRQRWLESWTGLAAFNRPEVRLDLCWSDPVQIPEVPRKIQEQNQRFAFGMGQFVSFMETVGGRLLVRGHEKVEEGFRVVYNDGQYQLYTLFSAGGANNHDLPERSFYRYVRPAYLTLRAQDGRLEATPHMIAWERYNTAGANRFLLDVDD